MNLDINHFPLNLSHGYVSSFDFCGSSRILFTFKALDLQSYFNVHYFATGIIIVYHGGAFMGK